MSRVGILRSTLVQTPTGVGLRSRSCALYTPCSVSLTPRGIPLRHRPNWLGRSAGYGRMGERENGKMGGRWDTVPNSDWYIGMVLWDITKGGVYSVWSGGEGLISDVSGTVVGRDGSGWDPAVGPSTRVVLDFGRCRWYLFFCLRGLWVG